MADYILGIDIGGTNIKAGIYSFEKKDIIEKKFLKTSKNLTKFLSSLKELISYSKKKYNIKKVGIGFPGNINKDGEIIFSPHIADSVGFNIVKFLKEKFNIDIKIENDANLAALAHFKFLENNYSDIICLTIGTGIGGGVVLNGKLLNSSRGIGFELGHVTVVPEGEKCSCGKKGCVEAYSSSYGMLKRYGDKNLKEFIELYSLHKKNDKKATKIIEDGFYYLGIAVGSFVNIFAPQIVYFAGGVSEVFDEFYENFINGVNTTILKFLSDKVEFKKSNLKNAGILGAIGLWI